MALNTLFRYFKVDSQEFLFQFQSHPNFPTALAFSDTLNFLGIKNDAYQLEKEYWGELPEEFITIYKNSFALIKKEEKRYKVFGENILDVSEEELFANTKDFVLLFEKQETRKAEKNNFSLYLYLLLGFAVLYSFLQFSPIFAVFNILSALGIYISLQIFNQKFGQESVVLNKICGSVATNTSSSGCSKIIGEDKLKIFGLKLSDFSLVYFVGVLLLGLFLPIISFVLLVLATASIAVIAYSLYVQLFVEKTFCKVCFLIISILLAQIAISYFYFKNSSFEISTLLLSVFAFSTILFSTFFINKLYTEKEEFKKLYGKNLRFKRNYQIFKRELLQKEKINFDNRTEFFFKPDNAQLHIDLVSNPYCGFCKDAHEILEKILEKYSTQISAQIRFNFFEEEGEYEALLQIFKNQFDNESAKSFLNILSDWFESRDFDKISKNKIDNIDLSNIIAIAEENKANSLTFTPVILINGYQFPENYDREDIFYFIDDLLEEEEI